jgi:hypothetical protein
MLPEFSVYSGGTVKKVAVIALVLLVLLVGMPFAMGMGDMTPCPSCSEAGAPSVVAMCLAIVSLFVLVVSSHCSLITSRPQVVRLLLFADPPERPPRVA